MMGRKGLIQVTSFSNFQKHGQPESVNKETILHSF